MALDFGGLSGILGSVNRTIDSAMGRINGVSKEASVDSPHLNNYWRLELPELGSSTASIDHPDYSSALSDAALIPSQEISERVVSASISFPSFMFEKGSEGNGYWQFPKHHEYSNLIVELVEHNDGLSMEYLQVWMRQMMTKDKTYFPPVAYKRTIKFHLMTHTLSDLITYEYTGCAIQNIADHPANYEGGDFTKYSVSFVVDGLNVTRTPVEDVSSDIVALMTSKKPSVFSTLPKLFG